ncbi:hypothetical protein DPMN_116952 [Dreissena polymorpha]|uniref:Uncharacterized protein n=1 Tax=Dreissena polymorpha TaxID=45954 RepID=A0A9D4QUF4_DREPO|nr:hypothetical protein DPMN_116952 [Dreissena polymorpha]
MQNRWALSAPVTSEYHSAMQDFIKLAYTTSPQHKNSTEKMLPNIKMLLTLHS